MTHGHKVLQMMKGNHYATQQALVDAIVSKFGADERFYTCSAQGMTAAELVDFLAAKGKFKPCENDTTDFTVDATKICNHQ